MPLLKTFVSGQRVLHVGCCSLTSRFTRWGGRGNGDDSVDGHLVRFDVDGRNAVDSDRGGVGSMSVTLRPLEERGVVAASSMTTESGLFALKSIAEARGQGNGNGGNRGEESDDLHGGSSECERVTRTRPKE